MIEVPLKQFTCTAMYLLLSTMHLTQYLLQQESSLIRKHLYPAWGREEALGFLILLLYMERGLSIPMPLANPGKGEGTHIEPFTDEISVTPFSP